MKWQRKMESYLFKVLHPRVCNVFNEKTRKISITNRFGGALSSRPAFIQLSGSKEMYSKVKERKRKSFFMLLLCFKEITRTTKISSFLQDLCREAFRSVKVEIVGPTTFLVTES